MKIVNFRNNTPHFDDVLFPFNSVIEAQKSYIKWSGAAYVDEYGFLHDENDKIVAFFFDDKKELYDYLTGTMGELLDDCFNGEPVSGGIPEPVRAAAEIVYNLAERELT